ncbi:MAG: hypothetical protein U0166_03120 [Acidobacteriota bacterium]
MNRKSAALDARFRFALLDYRIAKMGIAPRLTPATEVVRLSRVLERSEEARRPERHKPA